MIVELNKYQDDLDVLSKRISKFESDLGKTRAEIQLLVDELQSTLGNFKQSFSSFCLVRKDWAVDYLTDEGFAPVVPQDMFACFDGPNKPSFQFSLEELRPTISSKKAFEAEGFEKTLKLGERVLEKANSALRRVL